MTSVKSNLRPIEERDLRLVLEWRNSDRVRLNMYRSDRISWSEHQAWYQTLGKRTDCRYLIFERKQRPVGLVYFSDIRNSARSANWGFYLGQTDLPRGTGRELGRAGLAYGFQDLNLLTIYGRVLLHNEKSAHFHLALGFLESERGFFPDGRPIRIFVMQAAHWRTRASVQERVA